MNQAKIKIISRILDFNNVACFLCDTKFNITYINKYIVQNNLQITVGSNVLEVLPLANDDFTNAEMCFLQGLPFYSANFSFMDQETTVQFIPIPNDGDSCCEELICTLQNPNHIMSSTSSNYVDMFVAKNRKNLSEIFNMLNPLGLRLQELEQYDVLQYLNQISHNCYDLLKDNTNFSLYQRLVNNCETLSKSTVIINDLLIDICSALQIMLSNNNEITLETDIPTNKIVTMLDEEKIILVLINVISNACKFSLPNSTIKLSLRLQDSSILISIADDGIGISPENLKKIFIPFFMNDDNYSARGLGLGLPIAKAIVELHGGNIMVNSEQNFGTTVGITLPLVQNTSAKLTLKNNKQSYVINRFSPLYINFAGICDIKLF
ncbi:MAG: HAMP domain-containing sensor histidine kinase [Oscillospiraceae bacterium]